MRLQYSIGYIKDDSAPIPNDGMNLINVLYM